MYSVDSTKENKMKRLYPLLVILFMVYWACEDKQEKDCAGVEGGAATVDNCDNCVGGNTGEVACTEDCNGEWGGTAVMNCEGVCDATGSSIYDIDGNCYETIIIGEQEWIAENLKVTHYRNGDEIPTGYNNEEWSNLNTGAYAVYNDNENNAYIYGNLYNWFAVDDYRGVCPEGWNVPTDDEYTALSNYLGGTSVAGGKMKAIGTIEGGDGLWYYHSNSGETNESGFTGLPGGYRDYGNGNYSYMGYSGYFWSSIESSNYDAWYRKLYYDTSGLGRYHDRKENGFSVRCIRD